jgi:mono/diheme cytochrome c family protein
VFAAGDTSLFKHAEGGRAVYDAECAACHGAAGQDAIQQVPGLELPTNFPHFNDCSQANRNSTSTTRRPSATGAPRARSPALDVRQSLFFL